MSRSLHKPAAGFRRRLRPAKPVYHVAPRSRAMSNVSGRIAIITGASAGIGQAIAQSLASGGAKVVINARREDRLAAIAKQLGGPDRVALVPGDAAEPAVIAACLDAARETFGAGKREADLVVVNAGR